MTGFPSGVITRLLTYSGSNHPGVGDEQIITIQVTPMPPRTWAATNWRMPSEGWFVRAYDTATVEVPVTDQEGYKTSSGATWMIVENGQPVTAYEIRVQVHYDGVLISDVTKRMPVPAGDLSPLSLDTVMPIATAAGGAIPGGGVADVPSGATVGDVLTWTADGLAWEAGGIGGATRGLIVNAVDVATIPPGTTLDNLAAYYNSGASAITVAGVELAAGAHAVWAWVSGAWVLLSSGTATPPVDPSDTTAPVWSATLTTGTPTDTAVVIAASALATDNVAVTGYRWRLTGEGTEVARPITPSGLNFTITGLTASTTYAAPILWAVDAGGNKSAELTAQGFTTDAAPPGWVTIFHDTFTDTDGTLLPDHTVDYTANVGWTRSGNRPLYNVIHSNRYWPASHPDYGFSNASAGTDIVVSGKKLRISGSYATTGGVSPPFGPAILLNNGAQFSFGVQVTPGQPTEAWAYNVDLAVTSVSAAVVPASGDWVWELSETNMTFHINGTLFGEWAITSYQGRNFTQVMFGGGANDIYNGQAPGTLSGGYVDDVRIETWQ